MLAMVAIPLAGAIRLRVRDRALPGMPSGGDVR